jgi:hypothetical protein
MVTAPNITLALESVPVRMAGAAGGALQTAQRVGAAIGTAVLATIYYHVLTQSGRDYQTAVSDTLLCAAGLMLMALSIATADLMWHRPQAVAMRAAIPGQDARVATQENESTESP